MKDIKFSFANFAEICLRIFSLDPRDSDEWNSSLHFKTVPVFRKAPNSVPRLQAITKHCNENCNIHSIISLKKIYEKEEIVVQKLTKLLQ